MAPRRSISQPIILASITVALSIALLVGWILVIVDDLAASQQVAQYTSLLVIGVLSILFIIVVTVLFGVFIVRERKEFVRQTGFMDSVTHELKSPLAALRLCLETLGRPGIQQDQKQNLEKMMFEDVERLTTFIDDVLTASRVSQRSRQHEFVDIHLRALLDRCRRSIERRHGLRPNIIHIDAPPDVVFASDVTALETVVKNLLDNAVKYSEAKGEAQRVDVRGAIDLGRLVIEVSDNGIGIEKKYLGLVFDRFYRIPTEAVRSRHGTGLGLYVVYALVRMLGGRVAAHSGGVDRGTTFRVQLKPQPRRRKADSPELAEAPA